MPKIETNLKTAVEHLQARYKALSAYAKQLMTIARASGKPIPCDVLASYRKAHADYMKFGNEIFASLEKNKIQVEQVIIRNGEPVPDPKNPGHVKTLKIGQPLRPPIFSSDTKCETQAAAGTPSSAPAPAVKGDEVGVAPLVLGAYIVGGLIFTGVAGYFTVKTLEQIRLTVQGPDYKPDKQVEAYLKVYERLVASGLDPKSAAEQATNATKPPPQKPGTGWFGPVAAGAVVIGGVFLLRSQKS